MSEHASKVLSAKLINEKSFLRKKGVTTIGIGYKRVRGLETRRRCVIVGVERKLPLEEVAPRDLIPLHLGFDVETDVIETGAVKARVDRTGKFRPARGGVSIGHKDITAGTFGCVVYDPNFENQRLILSNNHVLANSNAAKVGDDIYQPGPHDGGTADDKIADLLDFVPISFGGSVVPPECPVAGFTARAINAVARLFGFRHRVAAFPEEGGVNVVDAAVAEPWTTGLISNEILEIGRPKGDGEVELGAFVKKSGRTTGYTEGKVTQIEVTVQVQYGEGKIALFGGQFISNIESGPGDSGSAILDENNYVVGLLFAGGNGITIFNPIRRVLDLLGVEIAV